MTEKVKQIAKMIKDAGASCMLVGGCVRDHIMGIEPKDFDIEVYGLPYDKIIEILSPTFDLDLVGRSFGVIKIGNDVDISVPRRDSKVGVGHKGFETTFDGNISKTEAASRRDFTVNSVAMTIEGEIIDPFGGVKDIQNKLLRATSEAFREDPLRVLRGMQFAGRFGFKMEGVTILTCRSMLDGFKELPKERIYTEWQKWAEKSKFPSMGLRLLVETSWVQHFPQIVAILDIPQDPSWHPEGNVFEHTCHCVDAAAKIADRRGFNKDQRLILVFSALVHDFGKPSTTKKNDRGRWCSHGHAHVGKPLYTAFLESIGAPNWVIENVIPIAAEHMAHIGALKGRHEPSAKSVKRLAERLKPATIELWAAACEADSSGRPPLPPENPVEAWETMAKQFNVQDSAPKPILMGRHLIESGYKPGKEMGKVLKEAFEAQLNDEFNDLEGALKWFGKRQSSGDGQRDVV